MRWKSRLIRNEKKTYLTLPSSEAASPGHVDLISTRSIRQAVFPVHIKILFLARYKISTFYSVTVTPLMVLAATVLCRYKITYRLILIDSPNGLSLWQARPCGLPCRSICAQSNCRQWHFRATLSNMILRASYTDAYSTLPVWRSSQVK